MAQERVQISNVRSWLFFYRREHREHRDKAWTLFDFICCKVVRYSVFYSKEMGSTSVFSGASAVNRSNQTEKRYNPLECKELLLKIRSVFPGNP